MRASRRSTEKTAKRRTPVVVFASGRGSNFRALCEASAGGSLPARITALVTNVKDAGAVAVAREYRIPCVAVSGAGLGREEHEKAILGALGDTECEWVCLAGYLRLFTPDFLRRFHDEEKGVARVINIHPSILPAFPGKAGYLQALEHGVKLTGATVHLVGPGLDDGPIIAQRAIEIHDDDTEETLSARGLKIEHELYVDSLARILTRDWRVVTPFAGARPRVVFPRVVAG